MMQRVEYESKCDAWNWVRSAMHAYLKDAEKNTLDAYAKEGVAMKNAEETRIAAVKAAEHAVNVAKHAADLARQVIAMDDMLKIRTEMSETAKKAREFYVTWGQLKDWEVWAWIEVEFDTLNKQLEEDGTYDPSSEQILLDGMFKSPEEIVGRRVVDRINGWQSEWLQIQEENDAVMAD